MLEDEKHISLPYHHPRTKKNLGGGVKPQYPTVYDVFCFMSGQRSQYLHACSQSGLVVCVIIMFDSDFVSLLSLMDKNLLVIYVI